VYATSSGKAILTTYPEPERTRILESLTYVVHEKTTVSNSAEMAAELDRAIQRSWCEDRGEYTPDVMGIGVPVIHDERRFGLAVAGPSFRMQDRRTDLAALLHATAARIRAILQE
jgi:DNA-binding IclR family transcriptional regulator